MNVMNNKMNSKWREIGISLSVSDNDIHSFDDRFRGNSTLCLNAVLGKWLENDPSASWLKIIDAIRDEPVNNPQVAMDMKNKAIQLATTTKVNISNDRPWSSQPRPYPCLQPEPPKNFSHHFTSLDPTMINDHSLSRHTNTSCLTPFLNLVKKKTSSQTRHSLTEMGDFTGAHLSFINSKSDLSDQSYSATHSRLSRTVSSSPRSPQSRSILSRIQMLATPTRSNSHMSSNYHSNPRQQSQSPTRYGNYYWFQGETADKIDNTRSPTDRLP